MPDDFNGIVDLRPCIKIFFKNIFQLAIITLNGVVKSPIYCVAAGFQLFNILHVLFQILKTRYALYISLLT